MSSDITDYSSDGVPEAELPGILVLKSDNAAVFSAKLADYALQAVGGVVDSFTQPETSPPSNTPELTVPDPKRANAEAFSAKLADYALQAVGGVVDTFTSPEQTEQTTATPDSTPKSTDSAVKPASTPKPTDLAVKPANTVISNAKTAAPKRQTLVHTPETGATLPILQWQETCLPLV